MNREYPRVLIVEDEETVNYLLCRLFQVWKWDYRRAFNRSDAMHILQAREVLDLIVLDLILPDADGIEILRWVREKQYPAHVVVITQKAKEEVEEAYKAADLFLFKPFLFDPLMMLAENIMKEFVQTRVDRIIEQMQPAPAPRR